MAEKDKRPMGFGTPSMRIQDEYKEVLEQIMAKKANWEKLLKIFNDKYKFADDGAGEIMRECETKEEITDLDLMEVEHRVLASTLSITQVMIARVGKELSECDERISSIEKELKDLRKALK